SVYPDGFDPVYYANKYPDVKAVCGNDAALLYSHYTMFGKSEKRFKNAQEEKAATPAAPAAQTANTALPAVDTSVLGKTYIDVCISTQTLTYVVDNKVVLATPVVTGKGGRSTPIGIYPITGMVPGTRLIGPTWDVWVDRWMRLGDTHCGLHDASWRSAFGGTVYLTNGSHGCVNLPHDVAIVLYSMVVPGTLVNLHY
ncbi:MAG: L,D-transpeptidase, partial [Lachnospiraceae bacterium]|nr:L,D-transpeptidase [Lachnospiraceae bacterium]